MAIQIKNPETGRYTVLTDKEIKLSIMQMLGLDPNSSADQKIYRQQYDIIRKRVKNYNQLYETNNPVRANEVFYRIQSRKLNNERLTAQQENILSTPSINTGSYKRRIDKNPDIALQTAKSYVEKEFSQFLSKYGEGRREYNRWLNEVVEVKYVNLITGEYIPASDIQNYRKKEYLEEEIIRADLIGPQDIIKKLSELAQELHAIQSRVYNANRARYQYNRREVGTPT